MATTGINQASPAKWQNACAVQRLYRCSTLIVCGNPRWFGIRDTRKEQIRHLMMVHLLLPHSPNSP